MIETKTEVVSGPVPVHLAIIMDGNGRWAQQRRLPRVAGHRRGAERARDAVQCSAELGVQYLTLFAFSSENWQRPKEEVSFLMELFTSKLLQETDNLNRHGVRLRVIGDVGPFPDKLRAEIERSEAATRGNDRMTLMIAANYGGRWDVAHAARELAKQVNAGELPLSAIDEKRLSERLATRGIPDPDLLIRTGGECRISNFLLWQLAYCELYFSDTPWPDFDAAHLRTALTWFAGRERRFGRTAEQLNGSRSPR